MTHHLKIRRGVFEANSSSTHSISISSAHESYDKLAVDDEGICRIFGNEFGWEQAVHNDAATKASYAMVWALDYGTAEDRAMLKKVVKACTDAKKVEFCKDNGDSYHPHGYIDHQSGHIGKAAFSSEEALADFLFNPRSFVETDNDNH